MVPHGSTDKVVLRYVITHSPFRGLCVWSASLAPFGLTILAFIEAWTCTQDCELGPVVAFLSVLGAIGLGTVAMTIPLAALSTPPQDRSLELVLRLFTLVVVLALLLVPRELLFGKYILERWAMRFAVLGAVGLPVHAIIVSLTNVRTARWARRLLVGQSIVIASGAAVAITLTNAADVPLIRDRWPILASIAILQIVPATWATTTAVHHSRLSTG